MNLKDILVAARTESGMKRNAFAAYFQIPLRTVEQWESGERKMPEYLLRLILYKLKAEKYITNIDESILDIDK